MNNTLQRRSLQHCSGRGSTPSKSRQSTGGSTNYLVGWGRLPFFEQKQHLQMINREVVGFGVGEEHLVFVGQGGNVYGTGGNRYGQLGHSPSQHESSIAQVFTEHIARKVYCTPFCTFVVNRHRELMACGMNNRGQLGLGHSQQNVTQPQKIARLSEPKQSENSRQNRSRSKLKSVWGEDKPKQTISSRVTQESLLNSGESIVDIRGGPFHTVALTSRGRIFYTGNLYKRSSLISNDYLDSFTELNIPYLGKVVAIACHLTAVAFLNSQGRVHILGCFGHTIYEEPYCLPHSKIMSVDLNEQAVYMTDHNGHVITFNLKDKESKTFRLDADQKAVKVCCGLDFVVSVTQKGSVWGSGDNSMRQINSEDQVNHQNWVRISNVALTRSDQQIQCGNSFVLGLVLNFPSKEKTIKDSVKQSDLARQNRILKDLLTDKNMKSANTQTDSLQSKKSNQVESNARIFDQSFEIPFSQLKLGKQIAQGGYGVIYKATWRSTPVAVKIFKIEPDNDIAMRDFVSECRAMQAMRHPNIVTCLGACTKPPHLAIVLELCEGGTLWSLMQRKGEVSWQRRRDLAVETARAMNYLHDRSVPVLHRDLKSLNILLDHSGRVKLADFGWTRGLANYMTAKIGTYQWMAPQVVSGHQYTQKADVYSFGIVLWEMASRQAPYRNVPGPQVAQQVLQKDIRPVISVETPPKFAALIQRCWHREPEMRPSFSQILGQLQTMKLSE